MRLLRSIKHLPLPGPGGQIYRRRVTNTTILKKVAEEKVTVTTYDGNAEQTTLNIDQSPSSQNTAPVQDAPRKAERFDRSLLPRLNHTMRKFTLDGKVAVITGGARGLGWNVAQALAEAGASAIALLDVKQDLGDAAAASLHSTTGIPVQFYKVDVRDENAIADVVGKITSDLGVPNIVINSAGVVDSNLPAQNYSSPLFRKLIDINLTGSFLVSQACARAMMAYSPSPPPSTTPSNANPAATPTIGSIIFLGSIAGVRVLHPQEQCAYNASKAAVIQLCKSLAAEWAPWGIRCNTISPGYMSTALNDEAKLEGVMGHWRNMTPMKRMGQPDELNGLAVFLASDASGFMTGSNVMCDGGYSCY